MKRYLIVAIYITSVFIASCGSKQNENKPVTLSPEAPFDSLITYIERNGDFINSNFVPALISAQELYQQLDSNILLLDTRDQEDFAAAHIAGARNIPFNQLLNFFEQKIDPNSFKKIVLICYSGQVTAYASALLRLLGYNNVFSLRLGMSSWHPATAKAFWFTRISDKYADFLEKSPNEKNIAGEYPRISTSEIFGFAILRERAHKLFEEGFDPAKVTADELFEPNHSYYIINYWPEDLYNKGHIPGAVQYKPKESLKRSKQLNTLPTDRPIVVYCYTGQHSAFVPAYLRLLGYDAKGLIYGTNSFMHGFMKKEGIRSAFTIDDVNDFPVVSGGKTSDLSPKDLPVVVAPRGGC
jgi:rhodanese-related sulfurtransferase